MLPPAGNEKNGIYALPGKGFWLMLYLYAH